MLALCAEAAGMFQSTFPRRERRIYRNNSPRLIMFQSTFPRRERRLLSAEANDTLEVSIHVPAKGTTRRCAEDGRQKGVSIHVPAKGTTSTVLSLTPPPTVSIHVPAKGTTAPYDKFEAQVKVSIHVPAKGTTINEDGSATIFLFQSTFPRRERPYFVLAFLFLFCFNPRSREGNDPRRWERRIRRECFNPRSREGNDSSSFSGCSWEEVSIHVPAKGTIHCKELLGNFLSVSIHVPAKGTTLRPSCPSWAVKCFNPRSREGNDSKLMEFLRRHVKFQSTFPRRERLYFPCGFHHLIKFQSTFPRRERPPVAV